MNLPPHPDVLVVGGGVIGLSIAWQLALGGAQVRVVDRGELGCEASWAGAGIIPTGPKEDCPIATSWEQLAGLSGRLHARWQVQLRELTGIDTGYRSCGAIYRQATPAIDQALETKIGRYRELAIDCRSVDSTVLADLEPALSNLQDQPTPTYLIPAEAQTRNPRHVRALQIACRGLGVELFPGVGVTDFQRDADRLFAAQTTAGIMPAGKFCLTAGCWSGQLAEKLGLALPVFPVRGQIALLDGPAGLLRRIINVGPRYLVPRNDGRLLIGSTEEHVGYRKQVTAEGLRGLLDFAISLVPGVAELPLAHTWSGLRPATADGIPYLGPIHPLENAWIATGHFRSGLQLSTGTGAILTALMTGQPPPVDLAPFAPERPVRSPRLTNSDASAARHGGRWP